MAQDDFKNVRISFWNHVKTEFLALGYDVTSTGNIKFEGKDFDTTNVTKWFEPHILDTNAFNTRKTQRSETWFFQVNCFIKTGPGQEDSVEIMQLVGDVRNVFENKGISVKDWDAVGDPHVVYLITKRINQTPIQSDNDNLMMRACTFQGRIRE